MTLAFEGCDSVALGGNRTQVSYFCIMQTDNFSVTLGKYFGLEGNHCNYKVRLILTSFKVCEWQVLQKH